ncbi:hypothetical protein B0H17DRAFT_1190672 [Mycena rosella]|uniref:Uncharacterized protein n=1 Tax=Mycena rosella TaxID=1033263 RepID=A0AAD7H0F2_MYCRO|nr:hypothetical protein B0H17DRAFT_1190672 [Mycena rosella]
MSSESESGWDNLRNYATHINRDGFSYYGTEFYARSHTPASTAQSCLVAKRQPRPHEDESEAFYIVQVVHYGLQPVKTKAVAKGALLAAFGGAKTIEVAKVKYLADKKQEAAKEEEKRNKRKRDVESAIGKFLQDGRGEWPVKKGKTQLAKLQASGELAGKFKVIAPFLTERWPDQTQEIMWLKLCPSSTTSHLWGAFDFGVVSGVVRSTAPLPTRVGESAAFLWRGRESGEGESTFGPDNVVRITFLGEGKLTAKMDWDMGNFDFAGVKLEGAQGKVLPKSLREWKATWRRVNSRAYERENIERWGKWGGDGDDAERPAGSDTTEGGESDRDEGGSEDGYDSGFNIAF